MFETHDVRTDRLPGRPDPAKDGLVRVFDGRPNDVTYLFLRGDEASPDKARPLPPATPAALGGGSLPLTPVSLPTAAAYPDRRQFVIDEDRKALTDAAATVKTAAETAAKRLVGVRTRAEIWPAAQAFASAALDAELAAAKLRAFELAVADEATGSADAHEQAVRAWRAVKVLEAQVARVAAGKVAGATRAAKVAAADKALTAAIADLAKPVSSSETARPQNNYPTTSSGRRLALAKWIIDEQNPLAARVAVNHVWQRHFGAGLVPTLFDFGANGQPPTHPALLDWLAAEFMAGDWSMKRLHRLIVASKAYRRDSRSDPECVKIDRDNRTLWRANVRRMEAETIRDSVLSVAVDDLAVVRSMWTTDNNHGAQLQFHTGRHSLEGPFPTIGSWVHYGLGALNDNLPQFVALGEPLADCCGGVNGHGPSYLGPEHNGVRIAVDPKNPLPFATPGPDEFQQTQRAEFDLLGRLNGLTAVEYPDDSTLRARIKSYELAYRMQAAVPVILRLDRETEATRQMYGLDRAETKPFGELCLAARRLAEAGVRFIQVFHGSNGAAGAWDSHSGLKKGHEKHCRQVDQPIVGLLKDLKQRGMLDDTLVVWGTGFGRAPGAQNADGRYHHPYGFSAWLAGGGIKGGVVNGATDELGLHAVEDRHHITDLHTTVLHQLGLDPRRLEVPGRKRLEIDYGHPIREIMA